MGWANCGSDSRGRPIGYAHAATCDEPGCDAVIDRGLSYACGDMHGPQDREDGWCCDRYFCGKHLMPGANVPLCASCLKERREGFVADASAFLERNEGSFVNLLDRGHKVQGLRLRDLAEESEVDPSIIQSWANGTATAPLDTQRRVVEHLRAMTLEDLDEVVKRIMCQSCRKGHVGGVDAPRGRGLRCRQCGQDETNTRLFDMQRVVVPIQFVSANA